MRRRGFTLLELMIVVAILGISAGLAMNQMQVMARQSRVRGAAKAMVGTLNAARVRAVATGCAHLVQINGSAYAGTGPAPFHAWPGRISIVRKGNCSPAVASFEVGDVVVDSMPVSPDDSQNLVFVRVPASLVAGQRLGAEAVSVLYDRFGHRSIAVDATGGGYLSFTPDLSLSASALTLTTEDLGLTTQESLTVPLASSAVYP